MKRCSRCKQHKETIEFYKNRSSKDGLGCYCKPCQNSAVYKYEKTDSGKKYRKAYYKKNKEVLNKKAKDHRAKNKDKYNKYYRNKRISDPVFKLKQTLRNRLYKALRGDTKSSSTLNILGCDLETAKKHIESQFQKGMTWHNHGKWHIDHKYPLSLAKNNDEIEKLCHYTNLQPLWAVDNIKKGNKT